MLLEGIVTTTGADGGPHVAPMGALVDDPRDKALERIVLRPYRSSTTYSNLARTGEAVFHVTDDVELLARAAVKAVERLPALYPAEAVHGWIVADACRWYALRAARIDATGPRAEIAADVVDQGRLRDFWGFNRAMHAVVEGAILASRIGLLPGEQIRAEFDRLAVLVAKTAGPRERQAWEFLVEYADRRLGEEG